MVRICRSGVLIRIGWGTAIGGKAKDGLKSGGSHSGIFTKTGLIEVERIRKYQRWGPAWQSPAEGH